MTDWKFKVGDPVAWGSQAQGYYRPKKGTVAAVVPVGQRPDREAFPELYRGAGAGFGRKHESYVIVILPTGKKKVREVFWPVVKNLRLVAKEIG